MTNSSEVKLPLAPHDDAHSPGVQLIMLAPCLVVPVPEFPHLHFPVMVHVFATLLRLSSVPVPSQNLSC